MFLKSFFLSIGCHHKTLILPLNPMAKWVHGISSTLAYLTMFTNIGIFRYTCDNVNKSFVWIYFMLQEKCNKIFFTPLCFWTMSIYRGFDMLYVSTCISIKTEKFAFYPWSYFFFNIGMNILPFIAKKTDNK